MTSLVLTCNKLLAARIISINTLYIGKLKHHIPVLAEIDVTIGRERIQKRKEETGKGLSFTGWIIGCLAEKLPSARMMRFFARLPFAIRKILYWNRLLGEKFRLKRMMGTIGVTSIGMFGKVGSGSAWRIPLAFHPMILALGAIARKPAMVGNAMEGREFLSVTVLFDHDVIDGAPVAIFLQRLRELIETGYGL